MDYFLHNHQSALDSQREEAAINWRFPEPGDDPDIEVGDLVETTQEYNSICTVSGKVVEDFGSKVLIIDDDAETDDNLLEFHKSDLQIIEPTDEEMMSSFSTKWHDGL